MIGQVLGHYRVVAKIGEGGMGVVYRAYDEVLHRDVALKVVKKQAGQDPSTSQNLLSEARASSALSHPNICTIYEVGETDGELYIVMELVEGKSLHAMKVEGGLAPQTVMRYGVQIAGALARAHDRGIIHRDLKSANVVVTAEGLVKVLDFGLARQVGGGIFEGPTQSFASTENTSGISGTLAYMAPEILQGEPADHRGDLWALGVTLYEAVSGRMPFAGRTGFEISSSVMKDIPAPLGPPVPPGFWAVIQRCLAKEPTQRYQRASEVQAALDALQSGAIVSSTPEPDPGAQRFTMLHSVKHVHCKKGDLLLLVGTTKGAFILRSSTKRSRWEVGGPYFHGQNVYAMAYDGRAGQHRIWASTQNYWGTVLRWTNDFGKSWTNPQEAPIRFPLEAGVSLKNIWQIALGRPEEPNVLYCGVEPAALFESRDGGESWGLVRGLFDHPHRPRWMPGNGGLALHTIVLDPADKEKMYVGISSGGVYRTDDGGKSWTAQNRGIRATFLPNHFPEFGQCVHKMAMHPTRPERLFLQNHWGVYRTDDGGAKWKNIGDGLPSDFGFAMIVHPQNPDCVFIVPVESDEFRCAVDGRLRVYRTRNAGGTWEPLSRGLPQKRAYETVLRDAMTADCCDPMGIYFGTRSGQLFGSYDEGKNWQKIAEGLPGVVCVRSAVVQDDSEGGNQQVKRTPPEASPASSKSRSRTASGSRQSKRSKR